MYVRASKQPGAVVYVAMTRGSDSRRLGFCACSVRMCVHVRACVCMCVHVRACVRMCVHVCACVHVCTCVLACSDVASAHV